MMESTLIKGAKVVLEGESKFLDVLIKGERIEKIGTSLSAIGAKEINAEGHILIPGMIDDQVHFREPGLTHKAEIFTESRAAVAGGITSYMEMPNTQPQALTQPLLAEKYGIAALRSMANYSFYMGVSNDNLEEVLKTNAGDVCGVKIFMGASTGNMLVDNDHTLESVFSRSEMLIALHCESEPIIKNNLALFKAKFGEDIPVHYHPEIRNAEACYASSSHAVALAKRYGTRIHVLHISTAKETELFESGPVEGKKITAEACVHHLWFSDADYAEKGNFIKWNPAVKSAEDRAQIWQAILDDRIDVIATDHAPHTREEKANSYASCPSGGPLVQHAIQALFEKWKTGQISLENLVRKTAHSVAILFQIQDRGFIREGFYADLVLVNPEKPYTVSQQNIAYKCGWSPFEGTTFSSSIASTFVNGNRVWDGQTWNEGIRGKRLLFNRK